jgi:hypothetical protein
MLVGVDEELEINNVDIEISKIYLLLYDTILPNNLMLACENLCCNGQIEYNSNGYTFYDNYNNYGDLFKYFSRMEYIRTCNERNICDRYEYPDSVMLHVRKLDISISVKLCEKCNKTLFDVVQFEDDKLYIEGCYKR